MFSLTSTQFNSKWICRLGAFSHKLKSFYFEPITRSGYLFIHICGSNIHSASDRDLITYAFPTLCFLGDLPGVRTRWVLLGWIAWSQRGPSLQLYLLCRVEFIARLLKRLNWRMPKGPSILWSTRACLNLCVAPYYKTNKCHISGW